MDETKLTYRVQQLERFNKRLRAALIVVVLLGGILGLLGMASSQPPSILEAQQFVLKDAAGHQRGSLFASDSSWGLVLYNPDQSKGAAFIITKKFGSAAMLMDRAGHDRIAAYANDDESNFSIADLRTNETAFELKNSGQGSALIFRDGNGTDRVSLGLASGGGAVLLLNDASSVTRTALSEDMGLAQFDAKGEFKWAAGWDGFTKEEQDRMRPYMQKSLTR